MRFAVLLVPFVLLVPSEAPADDCTPQTALASMGVLQNVIDDQTGQFGFPQMPDVGVVPGPQAGTWVEATGGIAAATYIETTDRDGLALYEKNVTAAGHQLLSVKYALDGRCGAPLSPADRAHAQSIFDGIGPWVRGWLDAVPKERTRRSADKPAAAGTCSVLIQLAEVKARIAREKSNPGGVVDLQALHTDGQIQQALEDVIAARKRLFLRDRGKPFAPSMCTP